MYHKELGSRLSWNNYGRRVVCLETSKKELPGESSGHATRLAEFENLLEGFRLILLRLLQMIVGFYICLDILLY